MDIDEAIAVLVDLLKRGKAGQFGYDLYPRVGAEEVAMKMHSEREQAAGNLSPVFFDAAWELCRRGIVRPGITAIGRQATEEGRRA